MLDDYEYTEVSPTKETRSKSSHVLCSLYQKICMTRFHSQHQIILHQVFCYWFLPAKVDQISYFSCFRGGDRIKPTIHQSIKILVKFLRKERWPLHKSWNVTSWSIKSSNLEDTFLEWAQTKTTIISFWKFASSHLTTWFKSNNHPF